MNSKEDKSVLGGLESLMNDASFQSGFTPEEDEDLVERETTDEELSAMEERLNDVELNKLEDNADEDAAEELEIETSSEDEYVNDMFEVFAEKYDWEIEDDEKPKSVDELLDYIDGYIEDKQKPTYANKTIEELDTYVKNGGKIEDFISFTSDKDYSTIDLNSESNQKRVVRDLLKRQGLNDSQIERKINKYEMADILQEEAEEAVEILTDQIEHEKDERLKHQEEIAANSKKAQQKFYNDVVAAVQNIKDIRGIKIPEKEKKEILDYIFKPTKEGVTRYYQDYASSVLNLVESAYFTKNKKQLIDSAKKAGEKTAVERFKQKLKTGNTGTSKKSISGSGASSFLDLLDSK